ncbi:MAG: S8 family serine peptidase [Gammaproteobacteria bacterium]|nr:S8 family serine peptidase [Gammaproteobacteria bacterium]
MKRISLALAILCLASLSACATKPTKKIDVANAPTNTLLVMIKAPEQRQRHYRRFSVSGKADQLSKRLASNHQLNLLWQWTLPSLGVHCLVIEKPDANTLASLREDKRVLWVQPNNQYSLLNHPSGHPEQPHEASEAFQQLLKQVNGDGNGATIAIVDTGVDINHPQLSGSKIMASNVVDDLNHVPAEPHGTAVAGLISAQPTSDAQITGLAPGAKIHFIRACWQTTAGAGSCNSLSLAVALESIAQVQPNFINLSLTGPRDPLLEAQLSKIISNGSAVIAAYDENRKQSHRFPPPQNGVIYARGKPGPKEDGVICAPSQAVSLAPNAGYDLVVGNSVATPHVTALAARMKPLNPELSPKLILAKMQQQLDTQTAF